MKRNSLLLFFVFLSLHGFTQSSADLLVRYCENFDYSALTEKLDEYSNKSTKKIKFKWTVSLNREIVDSYYELIIEFVKEVQDENNPAIYKIYSDKIKLIKRGDEICYYKVVKGENIKKKNKWMPTEILIEEKSNSQKMTELKDSYKKVYSIDLILKELFETRIVYGSNCGIAGTEPSYRRKLNEIIEKRDTTKLIKWLKSGTVELQLYAIDGIYYLEEEGIEFNKSILNLIEVIGSKRGKAYNCSGCSHWNEPINEIVNEIKKEHNK